MVIFRWSAIRNCWEYRGSIVDKQLQKRLPPGKFDGQLIYLNCKNLSVIKVSERPVKLTSFPPDRKLKFGLSWRRDGNGSATTFDAQAIQNVISFLPSTKQVEIEVVTLKASGNLSETQDWDTSSIDMNAVDCLVIPGGPFAISTQIGSENKAKTKDQLYALGREKFELWLIEKAKTRGMPVLAICAGSWRLFQSYGGVSKSFDSSTLKRHKTSTSPNFTTHTITMSPFSPLNPQNSPQSVTGVNSVHWASIDEGDKKPMKLLQIDAREGSSGPVEAFSSRFGAPHLGIQWHPEYQQVGNVYPEGNVDPEAQRISQMLYEFLIDSVISYKRRKICVTEMKSQFKNIQLPKITVFEGIGTGMMTLPSSPSKSSKYPVLSSEEWTVIKHLAETQFMLSLPKRDNVLSLARLKNLALKKPLTSLSIVVWEADKQMLATYVRNHLWVKKYLRPEDASLF
jgi:putative glutamine amidotransferase